jgi:hypothetical protein
MNGSSQLPTIYPRKEVTTSLGVTGILGFEEANPLHLLSFVSLTGAASFHLDKFFLMNT